jgi:hypothetical protein
MQQPFQSLEQRLADEARRLRAEAEELSPGGSVEELARYAELLPQAYFEYDTVDRPESDRHRPLRSAAAD